MRPVVTSSASRVVTCTMSSVVVSSAVAVAVMVVVLQDLLECPADQVAAVVLELQVHHFQEVEVILDKDMLVEL